MLEDPDAGTARERLSTGPPLTEPDPVAPTPPLEVEHVFARFDTEESAFQLPRIHRKPKRIGRHLHRRRIACYPHLGNVSRFDVAEDLNALECSQGSFRCRSAHRWSFVSMAPCERSFSQR